MKKFAVSVRYEATFVLEADSQDDAREIVSDFTCLDYSMLEQNHPQWVECTDYEYETVNISEVKGGT